MEDTAKLQRNRFDFYNDNYSNKVYNLPCFKIDKLDKWEFHETSKKLSNLGEVEDFLLVLKLCKNKKLSYNQILIRMDGLSFRNSTRKLLGLEPTEDLANKNLDCLGNVNVEKLTQIVIDERQELVTKIEEEIGMPIEVLDLIITGLSS